MKKLLVVLTVLAMATVANAAVKISVDGVVDPPDTQIKLLVSQTAIIDVSCDGLAGSVTSPYFLNLVGPGSLDITSAINTFNPPGYPDTVMDLGPPYGIFLDLARPALPVPLPAGTLIDQIKFHCDAIGEVTISLWWDQYGTGENMALMDTQVIHQIPEPMTLALLGLGGLFLRRRK